MAKRLYQSEGPAQVDPVLVDSLGVEIPGAQLNRKLPAGGGGASTSTVNVFTKNQSVAPFVLTDAASVATDASLSNNFVLTIGGNRTLANPTNLTDGMVLNWTIIQDGTGGHTLAYGANFDFGASTPALSTAISAVDIISGIYNTATGKIKCSMRRDAGASILATVNIFTKNQSSAMVALTDAATVAIDASLSNNFELLATSGVGATRALGQPTNPTAGMVLNFWFYQDASGSRALTFNAVFKFVGGVAPTASTAANAVDFYSFSYSGSKGIWIGTQLKGLS